MSSRSSHKIFDPAIALFIHLNLFVLSLYFHLALEMRSKDGGQQVAVVAAVVVLVVVVAIVTHKSSQQRKQVKDERERTGDPAWKCGIGIDMVSLSSSFFSTSLVFPLPWIDRWLPSDENVLPDVCRCDLDGGTSIIIGYTPDGVHHQLIKSSQSRVHICVR